MTCFLPLLQKTTKESHDCVRVNVGVRMESKAQVEPILARSNAKGTDNRDFLVRANLLVQYRSLTTRAPGSPEQRSHQHAIFIDKEDMRLQSGRFFLIRGQSTLLHSLILVSLRSTASRSVSGGSIRDHGEYGQHGQHDT
jgi:hypothetical protein